MADLADLMADAEDQQFAMMTFAMPAPVYKALHEVAFKEGITVPNLVTRALKHELERIEAKESRGG